MDMETGDFILFMVALFGFGVWFSAGLYQRIEEGRENRIDRAFGAAWNGIKYVLLAQWCKQLWR